MPADEDLYGQEIAIADLNGLLDAMQIGKAHIVGLSMGAYTGLVFAMRNPERRARRWSRPPAARAPTPTRPRSQDFAEDARARADRMLANWAAVVAEMTTGPARLQLKRKDPKGTTASCAT